MGDINEHHDPHPSQPDYRRRRPAVHALGDHGH